MVRQMMALACGLSVVALTWLLVLRLAPWDGRTVAVLVFWALLALALGVQTPPAKR